MTWKNKDAEKNDKTEKKREPKRDEGVKASGYPLPVFQAFVSILG